MLAELPTGAHLTCTLPSITCLLSDVCYAVGYSDEIGLPLMEGPELDDVRAIDFADDKMRSATMYSHLGRIRVSGRPTF